VISGFYQRSDHWMRYAAHNHLRVSRIIRSLALLQGEEDGETVSDLVNSGKLGLVMLEVDLLERPEGHRGRPTRASR